MNCVIWKTGMTSPGTTTVTLERGVTVVVMKDVPAQVCENGGEYYLDAPVAQWVDSRAEQAVRAAGRVEILRYAA